MLLRTAMFVLSILILPLPSAAAYDDKIGAELLQTLLKEVPGILQDQETTSGQFGKGLWIINDQHVIFPLAVAWNLNRPENPYYRDPAVLEAIMDGGDALIHEADETGQWEFRKKDGSTWGKIYMPWTYSRWIRTYGIIKDAMPPERRAAWEKALRRGYEGIAKQELNSMHNIPVHHAMGLYHAGQVLGRDDWMTTAQAFLRRAADKQHPDGYWSENSGPVVGYNMVYMDALGVYYALSQDEAVLDALRRGAVFHLNFTYPNGSSVETIDERQVYRAGIGLPNVGFTHTPEGRGYVKRQWEFLKRRPSPVTSAEGAAMYLVYGGSGEVMPAPGFTRPHQYVTGDRKALVRREGPWFICMSGYTARVPNSRWIQDRQNMVSLYHDSTGVFLGGGNTKLQPLWSTFTVGDPTLLQHKGEEEPDFRPPPGILHVATDANISPAELRLNLDYAGTSCSVTADLGSSRTARLRYALDSKTSEPVQAHLPLIPAMGKTWKTAAGRSGVLGDTAWSLGPGEAGEWVEHDRMRISLPPDASLTWPVLPHNPYRKDGSALPAEGKLVITVPLGAEHNSREITFTPAGQALP